MQTMQNEIEALENDWATNPRWEGITRPYSAEDVVKLRGSVRQDYAIARTGATKLWESITSSDFVRALGAMSGGQAVQMAKAGLKSIYLSGWQVAGDANLSGNVYPDQSLYPVNSAPKLVERLNNALMRADQIEWSEGKVTRDWMLPIMADAEAGFGGALNVFELVKSFIAAGASGIHLEDQLASEKKCGHMGGKVLIPTQQHIRGLVAARLAADVLGVDLIIIARTDSLGADMITSDIDERDQEFITGERTPEGFHRVRNGMDQAVARAVAYAPYADLIWCETSTPDLEDARVFAERLHAEFPGKMMAYNCSPSFNWKRHLDDPTIDVFQKELGALGYKYQFITLAGFHSLNAGMFELAKGYAADGMPAYVELQEREFAMEDDGYTATRHQREVGAGYFDMVAGVVASGTDSSTLALKGSTEEEQF
jgi:isocitrate lyase